MNVHPVRVDEESVRPADIDVACNQVGQQIAAGQYQAAWQQLLQLAQINPRHAAIYRLQGGILQQAGQTEAALGMFRQALTLEPDDSQSHTGAGRCLQVQGALQQALAHFRAALHYQCQRPKHAITPPSPAAFDHRAAEDTLWQVLAQLATAGIHAFATSGTLLGLTREGHLLPFDKDLDIGLPFEQMEAAAASLKAAGWKRKINMDGMVTPQEWHGPGVALDLCGFLPDPVTRKVISGFWFQRPEHPWSRVTEFPDLTLQPRNSPHGKVWHLADPEAILVPLYGECWRVPDPDFDTVIAACNMRGCSVLTQCYAFARIYSSWVLGRLNKALSLARHTLRHLPDDEVLRQAEAVLSCQIAQTLVVESEACV
ncbi:MAG: tetratricopeptide repeat protein [Proteobacteria bacterium]|nr:tetratricopeptide repeat protein [Pseudomonadota bacterium]